MEERFINVTAGGTREQQFLQINPLGKIPCLKVLVAHHFKGTAETTRKDSPPPAQVGNFVLGESATIMRYLAQSKQVPDHWYPSMVQGYQSPCCLLLCVTEDSYT